MRVRVRNKGVLIVFFIVTLFSSCETKINKETVIGVIAYEDFPQEKTDSIIKLLTDFYKIKVYQLPSSSLPKTAFTNFKAPRYRADSLIRVLDREKHDSLDYVLALTSKDICITKYEKDGSVKKPQNKYTDFGIMGLAFCPGKSCVISTYRLKNANTNLHLTRLKKVVVHEFGHNLGLPHCPDKKCVMTDAVESIATIDNAELALCTVCKSKIM